MLAVRVHRQACEQRRSEALKARAYQHARHLLNQATNWGELAIRPPWPDRQRRREQLAIARYWQVHGADDERHLHACTELSDCARCAGILDRFERGGRP
jgi:hypothetical protein